jgi:hypothetical protein
MGWGEVRPHGHADAADAADAIPEALTIPLAQPAMPVSSAGDRRLAERPVDDYVLTAGSCASSLRYAACRVQGPERAGGNGLAHPGLRSVLNATHALNRYDFGLTVR